MFRWLKEWQKNERNMLKTPNYDAKVKAILDDLRPGERTCSLTGEKWMMDEEEIGWYKKFNVPPHPWSPETRMKHNVGYFEMYQFWYRDHPDTGKKFVSSVHPSTKIPSLPDDDWFGRDFSDTNKEVELGRSEFDQMYELLLRTPIPASRHIEKPKNSITISSFGDVNSYFVVACKSKNSLYSTDVYQLENSIECSAGSSVTDSFRILQSHRMHNCKFAHVCFDCMDSAFLFDCRNCQNCFGATNKRNKQYLWFNEQLSKGEYEKRLSEVDLSCRSELQKYKDRFMKLMAEDTVWPENFNEKCTNVIGEYTVNAVDCKYIFGGMNGPYRDLYHISYPYGECHTCAFTGAPVNASEIYMCNIASTSSKCLFSYSIKNCQRVEYSYYCHDCEDCFGCFALQRKRFCIFNKQYTEEAYYKKLDEVKSAMLERGEYGHFFPAKFFIGYWPDGGTVLYPETKACDEDYDPLVFDPEADGATGQIDESKLRKNTEVPDCIDDMKDEDWLGVPVYDAKFGRRFAYLKPELDFYRKHRLAPPTDHFIERVYSFWKEENSEVWRSSICGKCQKELLVTINQMYPDRTIYCRPCYLEYLEKNG